MRKVLFLSTLFAVIISLASFTTSQNKNVAGAITYHNTSSFDISGTLNSPCTMEAIDYTGSIHFNQHGVSNNNKISESFHVNTQGVSGVGQTTGTKYQLIEVAHQTYSVTQDGCLQTVKYSVTFKIVSAGSGDNFTEKYYFTYTYNSCTDTYTLVRDSSTSECK